MKKITLIGSFSGRNAGDIAILANILHDFAQVRSDVQFLIPTLKPSFVTTHYGHYNVKPMGMMPWHFSLKAFGLATYRSMSSTDMVMITDNALFDRKLYNPLVNTLFSVALMAPTCKKKNIPIVFYNASVGPIETEKGRELMQTVLDATKLVTLRDSSTKELFEKLQLRSPHIHLLADAAINTLPSPDERLQKIFADENLFASDSAGTISFNVNSYIDNWSNTGKLTREQFCRIMAAAIDNVVEELGVDILLTVTQVMDEKITSEVRQYIQNAYKVRMISNRKYTCNDIVGILRGVDTHIGLRTHSLIFCAAVNTPMISINSYPKNAGFMRSIGQDDWMIEFEDLNVDYITQKVIDSWRNRNRRREELIPITSIEKEKARKAVHLVDELLG
ncbi:polysaccharide pyruvyl transferase family protein [Desulfosediminicola ganghwensis]|uniref:polysaccharide pyruvyl transferase family protein n=1 Tax=Desulfosediminicola ganghwensis TaxID=2569540 RepID=UPI0010AD75F7|nr:polysaccharide pyruvyl transferase family protein [Desulfosediminicola ganghwensis]